MIPRRRFLLGAAGLTLLPPGPARATPEEVAAAIAEMTGGKKPTPGRIRLDVPVMVENGNSVGLTLTSPPAPGEPTVESIHVFAEGNPLPHVLQVRFGPRAGRIRVATRIRLATSQTVTAVARLSDGTYRADSVDLLVTLAACLE